MERGNLENKELDTGDTEDIKDQQSRDVSEEMKGIVEKEEQTRARAGEGQPTFRSKVPTEGALAISSPMATLYRAAPRYLAEAPGANRGPTPGGGRTVELQQLLVARLRRQLLGVDDGRLEGLALGSHFCCFSLDTGGGLGNGDASTEGRVWVFLEVGSKRCSRGILLRKTEPRMLSSRWRRRFGGGHSRRRG